jgi:hypothetical protein
MAKSTDCALSALSKRQAIIIEANEEDRMKRGIKGAENSFINALFCAKKVFQICRNSEFFAFAGFLT